MVKLKKVSKPAERYFHQFLRENGSVFEVEITQQEYRSNFAPPTHDEGVYAGSHSRHKLEVGEYCDENEEKYLANVDGSTFVLPKDRITDDELNESGLEDFEKFKAFRASRKWL